MLFVKSLSGMMAKASSQAFPIFRLQSRNVLSPPFIIHILFYGVMGYRLWFFVCLLCYSWVNICVIMPVLSFVCPQWVCVLADGNQWDRQPRGRGSPGSGSAGEWHHPPRWVSHSFLLPALQLRPALSSFPVLYLKPNLPHTNLHCAARCWACKCLPLPNLISSHV